MNNQASAFADAAEDLVGIPYRRGGRDAKRGVDCIGLVCVALGAIGRPVALLPSYEMRNQCIQKFCHLAENLGLKRTDNAPQSGDVLVLKPACAQFHLAILSNEGRAIHAHAGLRRVTLSPPPFAWPLFATWRLTTIGDLPWPQSS